MKAAVDRIDLPPLPPLDGEEGEDPAEESFDQPWPSDDDGEEAEASVHQDTPASWGVVLSQPEACEPSDDLDSGQGDFRQWLPRPLLAPTPGQESELDDEGEPGPCGSASLVPLADISEPEGHSVDEGPEPPCHGPANAFVLELPAWDATDDSAD